jgi:hypothetical protein
VTKNNDARLFMRPCNWNEYNLNPLTRIHWRASLVPAAAVIPAPLVYIKVVAVKKLVVGSQVVSRRSSLTCCDCAFSAFIQSSDALQCSLLSAAWCTARLL